MDLSTGKEINKPSPFPLDERRHEQSNNAGTHHTNDHPKHYEPWRSGRDDGGSQCRIDAQELQSLVRQQEGIVYAVTGHPTGRRDYSLFLMTTAIEPIRPSVIGQ